MNVTVAETKSHLSEILRKAAACEEFVVTKHGKPYVKAGPDKPGPRKLPHVGAFCIITAIPLSAC